MMMTMMDDDKNKNDFNKDDAGDAKFYNDNDANKMKT